MVDTLQNGAGRIGSPKVRYGAVRSDTAIMLRLLCDTEDSFRCDEYGAVRSNGTIQVGKYICDMERNVRTVRYSSASTM